MTGRHLKIARLIYGYNTQEELASAMGVSPATIQRYEAEAIIDAKILGQYIVTVHFDMDRVAALIDTLNDERKGKLTIIG